MAHSTTNPVAAQPAKTHFDWLTILSSALFDGLKAYGAALMVGAPEPGAPGPSHLGTGETSRNSLSGAIHPPQVIKTQPSPTLPLTKPAWRHA